ncbi:DUF362 domain-containing protein [Desulfonatronum thiosulfatophilum]|nr:DUF362 domain-containing protein [Desulfonatronum thiosulfatophilum]
MTDIPTASRLDPIPVALLQCAHYEPALLAEGIHQCCQALGRIFHRGDKILVKPNLVSSRNARLSCPHPQVVRALCIVLSDYGVRVQVGDSPAFGSARQVARAAGLVDVLADLHVPLVDLGAPVRRTLACGIQVGLSRHVLDVDLLFNLPKLKAHGQLFVTAAAKNLFGCVSGMRKAMAHVRHGQGDDLAELILDLQEHLPPTTNLIDAVTAMHGTGPTGGSPCRLGLLAASNNAVALDTALYHALDFRPEQVPLWREARRKNLPGHDLDQLAFPLLMPSQLSLPPFKTPERLNPVSFHPWQMTKSMCKRAWLTIKDY